MPEPAHNRASGNSAEDLAVEFLTAKGMRIVKRNFHFGRVGEIDIIAEDGDVLVFVEVKSRSSTLYGTPEEAITPSKQRAIRKVAQGYLHTHNITNRECRFDVIAIRLFTGEPDITHLVCAF